MTDHISINEHSSIRIQCESGVVYIDPFRIPHEVHDADFILVTHNHYDHFSEEDIKKIAKPESVLIAPEKMKAQAEALLPIVKEVRTVVPGESYNVNGLEFETVPAFNHIKPFHPKKERWVGYIVKADGKRIYIAGDTDLIDEIRDVRCDIAMVPIGGTYTMDAKKAAELVNILSPEVAIPTHYGSVVGKLSDVKTFMPLVKAPVNVELKIGAE